MEKGSQDASGAARSVDCNERTLSLGSSAEEGGFTEMEKQVESTAVARAS